MDIKRSLTNISNRIDNNPKYKRYRNYKEKVIQNLLSGECYFPFFLQIQTVNHCNGKCIMCPSTPPEKIETMSFELYKKIIDEIRQEGIRCKLVLMLQNEPFLDNILFKRLEYVRADSAIGVSITSNGSLLNQAMLSKLEQQRIDSIEISLDSLDKNIFNEMRPALDFDTILENIYRLKNTSLKNKLAVRMVVIDKNKSQIKPMKAFFAKHDIVFKITRATNRGGALSNYMKLASQSDKNRIYFIDNVCVLPFCQFNILTNGDVLVCCQDWKHKQIMGNIKDSSIKSIWNSDNFRKLRLQVLNNEYNAINPCRQCSAVE